MSMDWCPTMLEAAEVAPHPDYPLDGISLLPLFADPAWDPGRRLYWRMLHRRQAAMRTGYGSTSPWMVTNTCSIFHGTSVSVRTGPGWSLNGCHRCGRLGTLEGAVPTYSR